jgi:hypothetical protein
MQMPSLVKYFAFVGAALLALLSFVNFILEPSTGATVVANSAKPTLTVRHEPGASRMERWRNEQAALKAAEQAQTAPNASLAAKSTMEQLRPSFTTQPAQLQTPTTPPAVQTASAEAAPAADLGAQQADEQAAAEAEAAHIKAEKAKAAKAAKKARLARERARAERVARAQFHNGTQQRTASDQQDQYYYYQRAQQQQQQQRMGYAYAPRQNFGPFGGW